MKLGNIARVDSALPSNSNTRGGRAGRARPWGPPVARAERALTRSVILGMLAAADAGSAHAAKWTLDNDWSVNLDSTVSFGVAVRASKPNCRFLGNDNGGCVGDEATPLQISNPAVFSSTLDVL